MKIVSRLLAAMLAGALAAAPAPAAGWWHHGGAGASGAAKPGKATAVPEPADAALFGFGLAGVAIGRRFRSRRKG